MKQRFNHGIVAFGYITQPRGTLVTDKIAQLIEALGLDISLASESRDRRFHEMLRQAFSQKYPSITEPGMQGYEAIEEGLTLRYSDALARNDVRVIGMLELLLEEDITPPRSRKRPTKIGEIGLASIKAYLHERGKHFRDPACSPLEAARSAFAEAAHVPVEWLVFQRVLVSWECKFLLTSWGIRCLGDLTRIPRSTLLLLTDWQGQHSVDEEKLRGIQAALKTMDLELKTK